MAFAENIPRYYPGREEMNRRIARCGALRDFDGGLPDSYMPHAARVLFNLIGFQPPPGEHGAMVSPVGAKAAHMSAIKISEGFNRGYCEALPGKGPMMHNHDTDETFSAMTGRWRASRENADGSVEHEDLDPLDVMSFPPGMVHRFENISDGPPDQYALLMFVIAGDTPAAEFTSAAMAAIERDGGRERNAAGQGGDARIAPRSMAARKPH